MASEIMTCVNIYTNVFKPCSLVNNYQRFLVNKTNRCTELQFYWYYDFTCFGQPLCPSSGVLSLHRLW